MKKTYLKPVATVTRVATEAMIAESVGVYNSGRSGDVLVRDKMLLNEEENW